MSRTTGSTAHALRSRRRTAALLFAVALGLLSACGGGDGEEGGGTPAATQTTEPTATETGGAAPTTDAGEGQTVAVTEGDFFIEMPETTLAAGSYTFEVTNGGQATHDLVVERDGNDVAATERFAPGGSGTLTVDLQPGEYVFYCSVGNHRAMGMEVPVTVTE
ncbi:MAG TPA: plastocyanin/azurin family copper-binding protein [Geodermatophilus sp.]|nr:plastocyanin/azurin family copper-binding protein [Geodermatophilus sp.]